MSDTKKDNLVNEFLDVSIPEPSVNIKRAMSNWVTIADFLYYTPGLKPKDIKIMIKHELLTKKRPYVVTRLYSRYMGIVSSTTKEALKTWLRAKKSPKGTYQKKC